MASTDADFGASFRSVERGFHAYKSIWTPVVNGVHPIQLQGQIQENRKGGPGACEGGPDAREEWPIGHAPPPPPQENFCIFYSLRLLIVHFQVKIQLKI